MLKTGAWKVVVGEAICVFVITRASGVSVGVRRRVGVVGTSLQSGEGRPVGESKGLGFSPPLSPGFGVVSPLGSQYLSIKRIKSGMVMVGV